MAGVATRSGWQQFQKDAREFFLDVHGVTRNFMGEHDWRWAKRQPVILPTARKKTRWNRFKDEMVIGSRSINNESKLEERITLGVFSSLYAIPYALGRTVYDGVLNSTEYAIWRTTGKRYYSPLHAPEKRKRNAYVLGAPVSAPLIATMAAVEAGVRAAGVSRFGAGIVHLAGRRAVNMSKFTRAAFNIYDAKKFNQRTNQMQKQVFSKPAGGWTAPQVVDRVGLVTIPGAVALTEVTLAAAFTGACYSTEYLGRVLGLNSFGLGVVKLAARRAANMSPYTRAMFGIRDKKAYAERSDALQHALFSKPAQGWSAAAVANRMSLVTFPGLIAAVTIGFGAAVTAVGYGVKFLRHFLGFTNYGYHIATAALMRSANISKRYFKTSYTEEQIKQHQDKIFTRPRNGWQVVDRVSLFTLPGLFALASVAISTAVTGVLAAGETIWRALGLTARGIAAQVLIENSFHQTLGCKPLSPIARTLLGKVITAPVRNFWDAADCVGVATRSVGSFLTGFFGVLPLAILGLSKSNYHRLNYYRLRIHNDLRARDGRNVDRRREKYHLQKLKECEQTKPGWFFSKFNVLHAVSRLLYWSVRYVLAPTLFATIKGIGSLFGLVPLIKAIHRWRHPPVYDMNNPVHRIKKRFNEIAKHLDKFGHLPSSDDQVIPQGAPPKRNFIGRAKFGLFTEARQIISLGMSPEERLINKFRDKFAEFVRVEKRLVNEGVKENINAERFLRSTAETGDRFNFDNIVNNVKRYYASEADRDAIDRLANALRNEVEIEVRAAGPRP